jgi:hypothetical protein
MRGKQSVVFIDQSAVYIQVMGAAYGRGGSRHVRRPMVMSFAILDG